MYLGERQRFFQFKKEVKIKIGSSIEKLELTNSLLFGTIDMESE